MIRHTSSSYCVFTQVTVEFRKDGSVGMVAGRGNAAGMSWSFKPGPAHLDTCEFVIGSADDAGLELRYKGYIDRGQRIESR